MDTKAKKALGVLVIFLFIMTLIAIVVISSRDTRDDVGPEGPRFKEMGVRVMDAFTTDKVTSMVVPPMYSMVFLVLELEVNNPIDGDITLFFDLVTLSKDGGDIGPSMMGDFVGRAFSRRMNISSGSNVTGYLHFAIFPGERPSGLYYRDTTYNVTFHLDLQNLTFDHRLWRTPLDFSITGCGRDPVGSGRESLLYFLLEVNNPSYNATHFRCWLIDLMCENGVKLDGLHIEEPGDKRFLPGRNETYKVYFDIPMGSPDRPKSMYQTDEGMSIELDSELYEDLV